jgi:hypothetical protein
MKRSRMCWSIRDPAGASTDASPPGTYRYQIGTVNGPRPCPDHTGEAARRGSAMNSSRSCEDNGTELSLGEGTDNRRGHGGRGNCKLTASPGVLSRRLSGTAR